MNSRFSLPEWRTWCCFSATSFLEIWKNIILSLLNFGKEFKKSGFRDKNIPHVWADILFHKKPNETNPNHSCIVLLDGENTDCELMQSYILKTVKNMNLSCLKGILTDTQRQWVQCLDVMVAYSRRKIQTFRDYSRTWESHHHMLSLY